MFSVGNNFLAKSLALKNIKKGARRKITHKLEY